MKFLAKHIKAFLADEQGATTIEYGLIAALIAVAIIIGAGALGTNLNTLFNSIATKLGGVTVN
jgi:pilus assembly protein Flp/PilA